MIRSDYIMRLIEQLVQVLAKIVFNKKAGNLADAETDLENAFNNIVGLNSLLIGSLSSQDIITLLNINKDKQTAAVKSLFTAKLLKEKYELDRMSNKKLQAEQDNHKILELFLYGIINNDDNGIDISVYYDDIHETAEIVNHELSSDTRFELFRFYDIAERYDKAENELFRLKESGFPDILTAGISFYTKLENTGDEILLKGNFSREEVSAGLKALKQ